MASDWEKDIINKLKKYLKRTGMTIDSIFGQFDIDGDGEISIDEFKTVIK